MNTFTNEIDLLNVSLGGNKEAFGTIVENYQSLVCSITYSATGDFAKSEELAQEAFIRAWKELKQLKDLDKFRAWLCTIARNLLRQSIRKQNKDVIDSAQPIENAAVSETSETQPDQIAISKEQQTVIWQALQEIPETYREPMVLFYREEQSIKQVAAQLDLSEEVTKQRLSRGRKLLKAEMSTLVEDILGKTAPKKAFTVAVLAALPATKASAIGLAGSIGTTGFMTIMKSFWLPVSSALVGLLVYMITGGYLMFICFIAFSAYLIIKEPKWFLHQNKRKIMLTVDYILLAVICLLLGRIYFSVFFLSFTIIYLLPFHPKCPEKLKIFIWGDDGAHLFSEWKKWEWKTPPQNWRYKLTFFISMAIAFLGTTIYIIYKTKPAVPWGIIGVSSIITLNFVFLTIRMIIKITRYRLQIAKEK